MSRIRDLLDQLCSAGVPFRPLWEVTTWDKKFNAVDRSKQPSVVKYNYLLANDFKPLIVEGGAVKLLTTSTTNLWTSEELAGDLLAEGEVIAIPWGGNANVQYYNGKFLTTDNRIAVVNDPTVLSAKFLYYFLQAQIEVIGSFYRGSGIKHPSMAKVLDMPVPVPPIEVQEEVVRLLDVFHQLDSALNAEMVARTRQYAHYRDLVLTFDKTECEWHTLEEVAMEFGRGKSRHRPRNDSRLYGGPYPFIQTGDIRSSGHLITDYSQTYSELGLAQSKLWPRGTICITIAANIAETGVLDFDACFPDSVIGMIVDPNKTSQHYVEYLLQSLKATLTAKGRGSAQANINLATFENEHFPFPPLEVQERIVSMLDKFDALANDPSSGLLAEIHARLKQYEYYRDRLVTFQEAVA